MKIRKQLIERFSKETPRHEIDLIAGINPNPPRAHNAIFYIRMESIDKDTGEKLKPEPIWLSLSEMAKLSVLMTVASQFWLERLDKDEEYSEERIEVFKDGWKRVSEAIDDLDL